MVRRWAFLFSAMPITSYYESQDAPRLSGLSCDSIHNAVDSIMISGRLIALSTIAAISGWLPLSCRSIDGWRLDRGSVNLTAFNDKELSPTFVKRWEVKLDTTSRFFL